MQWSWSRRWNECWDAALADAPVAGFRRAAYRGHTHADLCTAACCSVLGLYDSGFGPLGWLRSTLYLRLHHSLGSDGNPKNRERIELGSYYTSYDSIEDFRIRTRRYIDYRILFLFFDPDRRLIAPRWDRGGSVFALPQRYLFTNTILYCTHNSRHERQFP